MGRRKIPSDEKCVVYSISVIPNHSIFLQNNVEFNLSNFVQIELEDYINKFEEYKQAIRRL